MAGPAAAAGFTFFLPKIWSALWQKKKLEIAVKSLKDEHAHVLGIIQDCRLRDRDWGGTLLSIARLRRMANEIEDCIDSSHIAKTLKARADLLRKIPELKERSKQLGELYKDKQKAVSSSSGEESTTSRHQGGSGGSGASGHAQSFSGGDLGVVKPSCAEPVDMDGPIKELLELVKVSANETESKQLKVISISGFGGLGKTLLADQVYFHQDVCAQFTVRARVEAAGKSHDEVLEEILERVLRTSANDGEIQQNGEHSHGRAPQSKIPYPRNKSAKDKGKEAQIATQCVVDRLRSYLKNKRFLIVILDIQIWIDIASVLEGVGELHSRFIVTTTVQSIATKWASPKNHLYQMSTLKEVYSVELFFKEFNRGKWKNPDKGQLDSSKPLLKKCEGLPLALISTAKNLSGGILDNITCSEAWKKLCGIKHDDTSTLQKMQWVLASTCAGLSGTNITPALMDCLLYFSMFPPNHHVRKNSLMRRLLAEGMEQNGAGEKNNLEELIHRLIDRCTIQSMEVSTRGDVKQCKASSLMYEYIFHRSMSEEFMAVFSDVMDKGFNEDGYVRRLSIHATETGIGEAKLPDDLSHLHTLAVFDTKKPEATRNLANCLFGGKGVLTKYRVLRVLDLKECAGLDEKHLQTICNLLLLKYLSLGDSIVRVPRKIAQLKLLETLDLSRTKVVTVYIEVLGLPKLTHLLGKVRLSTRDSVSGVGKRKRFLANKCKLDTLAGFITGTSEAFPQLIGHMRKLNKVKIWIHSTADGKNLAHLTEGIKEFVRKDRYESEAGRSLSIDFSECIEQYLNRSLHFLNLQGPHTDGMQEIANIQGDAQGAQREQQEDAKQCMSTDGGSGRNQNKNMQHNNQEYQTEEGGDNAQGAQINQEDKAQQYLGSIGSSMSKQIKNMHHHTQGAQIKKEEEKAKQCLGSDAGTTTNQIHNMKDNTQESQTEEVEEIANIQSNTQEAQIERHEETKQCLCSNGDNMSKQIKNKQDKIQGVQIEKGDYIVNIQDITQGAQIHQEKEAKQCLSNEGDSTSNQIKNMQENSQEEANECLGSDGGSGSNQIKNNMQNNNQEYQTEEVEEIVNMQNDAQVAEIEQEETKQCLGGSSMSKQINNMQVVGEIMNIQDNTQGAQIHQEDAKECLGSEGGSTSNQIKNMPENSQDYQTQEKEEAKQGPDYDNANSTNGTGILQDLVEIRTEHDERPSKLTSLKLSGKLPRFPVQLVTQMTGIQRLCLSSTGMSGKDIVDALSVLPSLIYLKLREHDLRHLNIQNKQFPSLRRVCFSVKDGNLPCPTIIQQFCNLHEVYLHANLNYEAKRRWKEASESHPERPRIFFAESKYEETSSEAVTQNQ